MGNWYYKSSDFVHRPLTWSKESQVKNKTQENQPRVGGWAEIISPKTVVWRLCGVGAPAAQLNLISACKLLDILLPAISQKRKMSHVLL